VHDNEIAVHKLYIEPLKNEVRKIWRVWFTHIMPIYVGAVTIRLEIRDCLNSSQFVFTLF